LAKICLTVHDANKRLILAIGLFLSSAFSLQKEGSCEWAMLGSNQRPLPCEVRIFTVGVRLCSSVLAGSTVKLP
jgi:hypothetical protein